jgi:[ribosomal protein S18]-alanine N-acetyltransferase
VEKRPELGILIRPMVIATRYLVRGMQLSDIPQVMEIERESFPTMWPPTAYKRELQQNRLAHYIVIVEQRGPIEQPPPDEQTEQAHGTFGRLFDEIRQIFHGDPNGQLPPPDERAELVVGVVGVWALPDEAHIVTIATRVSHRRRGIGEMLLISAIELAQDRAQPVVTLEVRVSNEAALAMYEKYGFVEVGRRTRYYSDNHEDAFILTVDNVMVRRYRERFDALREEHSRRWGDFGCV